MPASMRSARSRRSRSSARSTRGRGRPRAQRAPARRRPRARRPTRSPAVVSRRASTRASKTYRYRIWNGDVAQPVRARATRGTCPAPLDVDAMSAAARAARRAARLRGVSGGRQRRARRPSARCSRRGSRSDPQSSADPQSQPRSADRLRSHAATGFLRHMVRTIVGTLVEVGRGRQPVGVDRPTCSRRAIARAAGPTAPAAGLFLVARRVLRRACGCVLKACTLTVYLRRNRNVA